MNRLLSFSLLAALLLSTACSKDEAPAPTKPKSLFFTDYDSSRVFRYDFDSKKTIKIDINNNTPFDHVMVEPTTASLVFADWDGKTFYRNVNSTAAPVEITGMDGNATRARTLTAAGNGRVIIMQNNHFLVVNLKTGAKDTLFTGYPVHWGATVDTVNQVLYWGQGRRIFKAPLNKSVPPQVIVPSREWVGPMFYDYRNAELVFVDNDDDKVMRVKSDGTNLRTVVNAAGPTAITFDPETRRIYYIAYSRADDNAFIFSLGENGTGKDSISVPTPDNTMESLWFYQPK